MAGVAEILARAPCAAWQREWAALRSLVRLLGPIIASSMVNVMADRWTLAFVGHWDFKDRAHYDGMGIGKMYSNITGLSLGVSATIGLATFCAQAHGSGRARELNPVFLRRALLLLTVLFAVALGFAAFCEPLLLLCGQPPAVARASAHVAQLQALGLPFYWASNAMNVSLNSTKNTLPGFVMSTAGAAAQLAACALFTYPGLLGWGYLGAAAARALGGVVSLSAMCLCVKLRGLQELVWRRQPDAEPVLRPGAFQVYLKVSVPSALVVWSEWWAFEVLTVLVGLLPNAELNLAAHGTMFNIIVVFYMCWTGTCTSVCALVGNLLGAGKNEDIPPLLRAAFAFSSASSLLVALGYETGKAKLAAAFTEDAAVRALICSSSWGVVLSVPLYAQLMTFYGALRGANFQRPGILGTFVGYWVVGLPLAGYLGCKLQWPTPLLGIWSGNVVALLIASSWVCWAVFVRIDWQTVRRVTDGSASLLDRGCARGLARAELGAAAAPTKSAQVAGDDAIQGA